MHIDSSKISHRRRHSIILPPRIEKPHSWRLGLCPSYKTRTVFRCDLTKNFFLYVHFVIFSDVIGGVPDCAQFGAPYVKVRMASALESISEWGHPICRGVPDNQLMLLYLIFAGKLLGLTMTRFRSVGVIAQHFYG